MAFTDQTLTCKDCGKQFTWTAGEQEFYQKNNFQNAPQRCAECRKAKKMARNQDRKMYPITCTKCGQESEVPFEPKGDGRPVLCKACFEAQRNEQQPAA